MNILPKIFRVENTLRMGNSMPVGEKFLASFNYFDLTGGLAPVRSGF